jgi:cytoskeleton protein RodZ
VDMIDGQPEDQVPTPANDDAAASSTPATASAPATIGQRLRAAREAAGLSLQDVAAKTRVNRRMLDAIERDAYSELPVGPYAASFARSFATAVGLDGNEFGEQTRAVAHEQSAGHIPTVTHFEPADASRTPPRALAFGAAAVAGLLVAAYFIWQAMALSPATDVAAPATETATSTTAATPAPTAAAPEITAPPIADNAPILISASGQVWFSLEDATGRSQFDLTLGAGEYYTLKTNQRGLFLRTGAPQNLRVLIDGQPLPPLGTLNQTVRGVALDNASLARRRAGLPTPPPAFAQPTLPQPTAAPAAQ